MHSKMKPVSVLRLTLLCAFLSLSQKLVSASEENSPSSSEPYEWEDESYLAELKDHNGECPDESNHHRHKRTAVFEDDNLWPNATIPYVLTEAVQKESFLREAILESIEHWHERTCIKFVQYENSPKIRSDLERRERFVEFVLGKGCHSSVGRRAETGSQNVSIANECAYREMVIHELGHLVGLWHEHARYDRDGHVIILWNNMKEKVQHNFDKQRSMRLLAPYDLSSIMHYNLKTFSAKGENVMKAIHEDLQFLVGYRRDLSFYDGYTVNTLYKCSAHCGHRSPKCLNGGYLSKDCTCVCPRLLTGPTCDEVLTDPGCGGVLEVGRQKLNIKSPNYPKSYPEETDCSWLLKSSPGTVILLYLEDVDLEMMEGGTCKDSLEIRYHYIGIDHGPIVCGNLTTLKHRKEFQSTSNRMIVRFHSSSSHSGRGFNIIAKVLPKRNCASNPCQHGAKCRDIPETESYFCDCPSGWLGQDCHIEIMNGQWSEWSSWSGCAAQCGREHRGRQCKKGTNGGSECSGPTGQSRRCKQEGLCHGHFYCDFGTTQAPDDCGMVQVHSPNDRLDWTAQSGATSSVNTGPKTGHSTGDLDDTYFYIEASDGQPYDNATLWLPSIRWSTGRYCLQFHYHMYGRWMGQLRVLRRTKGNATESVWQESGCHGTQWNQANVNIMLYSSVRIGFVGIRGDGAASDIAIDDISISPGGCVDEMVNDGPSSPPSSGASRPPNGKRIAPVVARQRKSRVCSHNSRRYRVGKFSYVDRCQKYSCFCNQNGRVDCPPWKMEKICDDDQTN